MFEKIRSRLNALKTKFSKHSENITENQNQALCHAASNNQALKLAGENFNFINSICMEHATPLLLCGILGSGMGLTISASGGTLSLFHWLLMTFSAGNVL